MCAEEVTDSQSSVSENISHNQRLSLARRFVAKLKSGLSDADNWLKPEKQVFSGERTESNVFEEGELLLLQPVLQKGFRPDGLITGQIKNGVLVVSMLDFADVLQLAINVESEGQVASGWYIRENKEFSLDMASGEVQSPQGIYKVSGSVFSDAGDIFVPVDELALWLGFEAETKISNQEIKFTSEEMMPVQANLVRKNKKYRGHEMSSPSLPLGGEEYTVASVPIVDVTTRSTYRKQSNQDKSERDHQATVKTVGDFAAGTLTTLSVIDDDNKLARARVTYEQDSLDGDLLGSLKAKHLEVGDIVTASTPINGGAGQELGMRVTNTDPTQKFSRASTTISGNALPGWDVELYRYSQFLGIIHIGDDGFYSFDDVTLFSDNDFKLVFYGPQGEQHEELIYVPFDRDSMAKGKGIYDISLSFDGKNTYVNDNLKRSDRDSGSARLVAMYEKPLSDGVLGSVGFHSEKNDGRRDYVGSAGLSMVHGESLINLDAAVDNEGDGAAKFSVRRDFADHEMNITSEWRGAHFDDDRMQTDFDADKYENSLTINGPLPIPDSYDNVFSARYNSGVTYEYQSGNNTLLSSMLGLNFGYKSFAFYGDVQHKTGTVLPNDKIDSSVNLNLQSGANKFRLTSGYEIYPNAELDRVSGTYSRDITKKLDMDLSVSKDMNSSLTDYTARLDWQAGFIRISPSVTYNSKDDFFAGINTRFGLMREPVSGDIKMFDKTISNNAFVSAFVYLDKDGDGIFNNDDKPLSDIAVSAPQNGRRATTNEKGVALFERMSSLRLTDVFVDLESLPDPAWVPGFDGVSILPRQGYVAEVEFPVHLSGELDGAVFANVVPLPEEVPEEKMFGTVVAEIEPASGVAPVIGEEEAFDAALEEYKKEAFVKISDEEKTTGLVGQTKPVPLRNIELLLYNDKGEVEQKTTTEVDGFYYFSQIPPGRYYLMISEESAQRKNFIRPKPQPIEITYEGTLIYDNKIFVDTGVGDVPSEIVADMKGYKERHPHVQFDEQDHDLVLNLGEFNSRLLMSLVWYKIRTKYGHIIGEDRDPLVPPAESFANVETGKHSLRLALDDMNLEDAYTMCRSMMVRERFCKVEIYPSYMSNERIKLAKAVLPSDPMDLTGVFDDDEFPVEDIEVEEAAIIDVEQAMSEEQIRKEEEAAIRASTLDAELIRQIRARIEATAAGAATGRPIDFSAPSKVLIP